jgi:hypothetical protein
MRRGVRVAWSAPGILWPGCERLRELLLDQDRAMVSLDGEREDETYVLEHRGRGWLVFFLERGRKRDFRKHSSEDAACRDLLGRLER